MAAAAVLAGAISAGAAVTGSASAADNPSSKKGITDNLTPDTHLIAIEKAPWVNSFRISLLNGNETPNTPAYCFTGRELYDRVAGDFVVTRLEITSFRLFSPDPRMKVPPSKVQWFARANCTGPVIYHRLFRAYDDTNMFWYVRMNGPDTKPGP